MKTNMILKRIVCVMMIVAMNVAFIPVVNVEAANKDQTITITIPNKFYKNLDAQIEASPKNSVTCDSILKVTNGPDMDHSYYVRKGGIALSDVVVNAKVKNAVYRVDSVSNDIEFQGKYSDSMDDIGNHDIASSGMYIHADEAGKIPVGEYIHIHNPGKYSISLENITSKNHEIITLNIDTNYKYDTNNTDGILNVDTVKRPTVSTVSSDKDRSGTEIGSRIDDRNNGAMYYNGVYYLDYNNGNNTFLLKFPFDNRKDIVSTDWVKNDYKVGAIRIDVQNTPLEIADSPFLGGKKLSDYVFSNVYPTNTDKLRAKDSLNVIGILFHRHILMKLRQDCLENGMMQTVLTQNYVMEFSLN